MREREKGGWNERESEMERVRQKIERQTKKECRDRGMI